VSDPRDRCIGCPLAVGHTQSTDPQHDVLRRNETLFHAIATRDVATLEDLAASEFRFETAAGESGDRRSWLEGVRAMPYTIESITNEDLRLRLDGDRAVLCGVQRAVVLIDGKPIRDDAQFCDRWETRDGRWQVTFAGSPPRTS
jgi:hypothetical protein